MRRRTDQAVGCSGLRESRFVVRSREFVDSKSFSFLCVADSIRTSSGPEREMTYDPSELFAYAIVLFDLLLLFGVLGGRFRFGVARRTSAFHAVLGAPATWQSAGYVQTRSTLDDRMTLRPYGSLLTAQEVRLSNGG